MLYASTQWQIVTVNFYQKFEDERSLVRWSGLVNAVTKMVIIYLRMKKSCHIFNLRLKVVFVNYKFFCQRSVRLSLPLKIYPPASKASKEVANLSERGNLHTPIYGVKEFFCLLVYLSVCYKL